MIAAVDSYVRPDAGTGRHGAPIRPGTTVLDGSALPQMRPFDEGRWLILGRLSRAFNQGKTLEPRAARQAETLDMQVNEKELDMRYSVIVKYNSSYLADLSCTGGNV